ncbi:MAG: hypothetical protein JJE17_05085 [Peptostreptococcaceae bacterium]|nr:hypothetical protein [Peptostreptococcaceae bacterium]
MFGKVLRNPGRIGKYLEDMGSLEFFIQRDSSLIPFSEVMVSQDRNFPMVTGEYQISPDNGIVFSTTVWAPIGTNNLEVSSLPVVQMEFEFRNQSKNSDDIAIVCKPSDLIPTNHIRCLKTKESNISFGELSFTSNYPAYWDPLNHEIKISLKLKQGEKQKIRIAVSVFDKEWVSANYFNSHKEMIDNVFDKWDDLKSCTYKFKSQIPVSGDKKIDEYMLWNIIPAIVLTKCTKNGEVLTMGYTEMNQRDSYWTSWMHLVLFSVLEKKMIEESASFQQLSGKIPTTILPLIERNDDLDINAYFVLRALRYVYYYNDIAFGKELFPYLERALDWLVSRDIDGFGLPKQHSFWGDWKDVPGVDGRTYSPYTAFLYLAALRQTVDFAKRAGMGSDISRFKTAYSKGIRVVNAPVDQGGMWNGKNYVQLWKDKRKCDKILEDQMVGVFFGIVNKERSERVIKTIELHNTTPYGVAETFPYYPKGKGFSAPGNYHNGGVWPHLNFMDAWARIKVGKEKSAFRLIKNVCKADLSGDFTPNEYLNSITGENKGMCLQGWNANYFGVVYFGILNHNLDNLIAK